MVPETNQERPVGPQQLDSANSDPGPNTPDKPPSGRSASSGIELKDLRAAFRKFEESKSRFIKRIKEIRRVSSDNANTKAKAELQMKDAQDQLSKSSEQLRTREKEVSSLRTELDTAKGLLEEIDKTLT